MARWRRGAVAEDRKAEKAGWDFSAEIPKGKVARRRSRRPGRAKTVFAGHTCPVKDLPASVRRAGLDLAQDGILGDLKPGRREIGIVDPRDEIGCAPQRRADAGKLGLRRNLDRRFALAVGHCV